jgi:hypothetical protein
LLPPTRRASWKPWRYLLPQRIGDQRSEVGSAEVALAAPAEGRQDDAELCELAQPSAGNSLADFERDDDRCDDEFFSAEVQNQL